MRKLKPFEEKEDEIKNFPEMKIAENIKPCAARTNDRARDARIRNEINSKFNAIPVKICMF